MEVAFMNSGTSMRTRKAEKALDCRAVVVREGPAWR